MRGTPRLVALVLAANGIVASQPPQTAADLLADAERLELDGGWNDALAAYDAAITRAEQTLGPKDPMLAKALMRAASLQASLTVGYPIGHRDARRRVERAKAILGDAFPLCGNVIPGLQSAEAQACLVLLEESEGPESASVARVLNAVALMPFVPDGRPELWPALPDNSLAIAERALEINTRVFGTAHPAVATSELALGMVLAASGACGESGPHLDRALEIVDRTIAPAFGLPTLALLAKASYCTPPPEETADFLARMVLASRRTCAQGGEAVWSAAIRGANALLRRLNEGDADGAEVAVRLFPEAVDREADRLGADDGCRALARALDRTWTGKIGDAAGAARIGRDMERRLVGAYGPETPALGMVLNGLAGTLLFDLGERDQALAIARRGVAITDREGVEPWLRGLNLNMLAMTLGPERDVEREELVRRAIAAWEPDAQRLVTLRTNLGTFAEERGDLETARRMFEECAAVAAAVGVLDNSDQPSDHLGALDFRLGRLEEAEAQLRDASERYAKNLGPGHPARLRVEATLAAVRAARGDRMGAFRRSLGAASLMRDQLRIAARGAPERVVLKLVPSGRWGLDVTLAVSAAGLDPAKRAALFDEVIRSRAVVLDEISGRRRLAALGGSPATSALAADVAKYAMRLANLTVSGSADEKILALWRERKERAEETLALESASFAKTLASEKVGLEEVRKALPESTALVSFVRYDADAAKPRPWAVPPDPAGPAGAYLAFVLHPRAEAPAMVPLGPASKIDDAVRQWRTGILTLSSERQARDAGARLRRLVWDPLAKHLGNSTRALIVPDGSLSSVSFAVLPDPEGRFLVERGPLLHLVSAERDLAAPRIPRKRAERMLVVGDPAFEETSLFASLREGKAPTAAVPIAALDAPMGLEEEVAQSHVVLRGRRSSCGWFESMKFERLPGTAKEAEAVAGLWGDRAQLLSGTAAAEAAIKGEITHHRMVHLATHGFFLGGECAAGAEGSRGIGAVVPSPTSEKKAPPVSPPAPRESPLLFSGLALAGANHREAAGPNEDDGILTAEEIAALHLTGVEWAVLSACDTGVGDFRAGEGVFGLRRAFQVAGAGTLIMSLWPVDDESTREWMTALYRGRLEKALDTAEAVRQASLSVLAHRRATKQSTHPFYWAAFVAAGDWR